MAQLLVLASLILVWCNCSSGWAWYMLDQVLLDQVLLLVLMQRNVPGVRKVGGTAPVGMKIRRQPCPEKGQGYPIARRIN